jgi:hypothetical protein
VHFHENGVGMLIYSYLLFEEGCGMIKRKRGK